METKHRKGGFLLYSEYRTERIPPTALDVKSADQSVDFSDVFGRIEHLLVLGGALWKRDALHQAFVDLGVGVDLAENFDGISRPELKTNDTLAIVERKFDQKLADYCAYLNTDAVARAREMGKVKWLGAMDTNFLLGGTVLMSKQPWQSQVEHSPAQDQMDRYIVEVTHMFESLARRQLGTRDLRSQSVNLDLDLNVVEKLGLYRVQQVGNTDSVDLVSLSPGVVIRNKGFVRFNLSFNADGVLWDNPHPDGHPYIREYFESYDRRGIGKQWGEIPFGLAWEHFLKPLSKKQGFCIDLPDCYGGDVSDIGKMANGFHVHAVSQAYDALRRNFGRENKQEIVIWNYPKP